MKDECLNLLMPLANYKFKWVKFVVYRNESWYNFFQNYEKLKGIRMIPFRKHIKLLVFDIHSEGIILMVLSRINNITVLETPFKIKY